MSVNEVLFCTRRLPDKSCATGPIPVSIWKQLSNDIDPYSTELFNRTLSQGHFLTSFKVCLHFTATEETRPKAAQDLPASSITAARLTNLSGPRSLKTSGHFKNSLNSNEKEVKILCHLPFERQYCRFGYAAIQLIGIKHWYLVLRQIYLSEVLALSDRVPRPSRPRTL